MSRTSGSLRIPRVLVASFVAALLGAAQLRAADFGPGFKARAVTVDGGIVSVTTGGSGPPVVLIHGYAETSRMWKPLAVVLAPKFTVVAPDLPGIAASSIPESGIHVTTPAQPLHPALRPLAYSQLR